MKKFFKLGKRMMALFIVVLLNINSYAAVGANDGSAFVTKAEFDALVNTFNEQMDSYTSGLNSKIDGAIANYLSGLSSVTSSSQTALFIKNAGADAQITFRTTSDFPYAYDLPSVNLKFTYSNSYSKKDDTTGQWFAWGKSCFWQNSRSANAKGKRILGDMIDGNYYYRGYTTNYSEEFDINWSFCNNGTDDGYNDGDYFQYPVCFVGTQNARISNNEATWSNLKTFLMHLRTSDRINTPTAITADVKIPDHNYTMEYDAVYAEKADTDKLYRFVDANTDYLVAGDGWSVESGALHDSLSNVSRTSYICIQSAIKNKTLYKEPSANFTNYGTYNKSYFPTVAPLEIGNGTNWASIMYNDTNIYEYKKGTASSKLDVRLHGYSMIAGLPLCIVTPGDKIKWSYSFTTELSGRILYLKYGPFDGTNVSGDDVTMFDVSKKTGTIEFKSERYDIMFIKWPVGQTMDCSGCSIVDIQNEGDMT